MQNTIQSDLQELPTLRATYKVICKSLSTTRTKCKVIYKILFSKNFSTITIKYMPELIHKIDYVICKKSSTIRIKKVACRNLSTIRTKYMICNNLPINFVWFRYALVTTENVQQAGTRFDQLRITEIICKNSTLAN